MRKIYMVDKQASKTIKNFDKNLQKKKFVTDRPKEIGGPKGLEPTRYGDWEKNGRCIDF